MEDSLNKIPPLPGSEEALKANGLEKEKSDDVLDAEKIAKAIENP
jgi:hypothetical protein